MKSRVLGLEFHARTDEQSAPWRHRDVTDFTVFMHFIRSRARSCELEPLGTLDCCVNLLHCLTLSLHRVDRRFQNSRHHWNLLQDLLSVARTHVSVFRRLWLTKLPLTVRLPHVWFFITVSYQHILLKIEFIRATCWASWYMINWENASNTS